LVGQNKKTAQMVETMHVVESSGGPRDRENEGLSA